MLSLCEQQLVNFQFVKGHVVLVLTANAQNLSYSCLLIWQLEKFCVPVHWRCMATCVVCSKYLSAILAGLTKRVTHMLVFAVRTIPCSFLLVIVRALESFAVAAIAILFGPLQLITRSCHGCRSAVAARLLI